MKRLLSAVLASLFLFSFFGCGSSGISNGQRAHVRFVNGADTLTGLTLLIDGIQVVSDSRFGESSGYVEIDGGARLFELVDDVSGATLRSERLDLDDDNDYSYVATGATDRTINASLIQDKNDLADRGTVKFRAVNASSVPERLDVYLLSRGNNVLETDATFPSLVPGEGSFYVQKDSGDYRITVTDAGTKSIAAQTGEVEVGRDEVRSIFVLRRNATSAARVLLLLDNHD